MNSFNRIVRSFALFTIALAISHTRAADPVSIAPAYVPVPDARPQLGVNLEGVVAYARSMVFVDAMKSARKFGSAATPWDESGAVDPHGWPTGDVGIVVMADVPVAAGE